MERPSPSQCVGHTAWSAFPRLGRNALDTPSKFGRRASGESQEKNATRIRAVDDKVGDPMRQSFRLAGACAGDHEKWRALVIVGADAVLNGSALLPIEFAEIRGRWQLESAPRLFKHGSGFVLGQPLAMIVAGRRPSGTDVRAGLSRLSL